MSAVNELRQSLTEIAKRSVALMKACNNEESIKLYLALPMIGLLGYDSSDPLEVYPNHETDPVDGRVWRADFAILNAGEPVIAFGVGRNATDMAVKKLATGAYFAAWPSTKLAVLTNGIIFEFFVDSGHSNVMDAEPFLSFDLETIAQSTPGDDVLETLVYATKGAFDPDMIAERAHLQLVRKRMRTAFIEEAQTPSEEFCRMMLARIGFAEVRKEAIDRHYAPIVKGALEEALVLPVVQRLRSGNGGDGKSGGMKPQLSQRIAAAERELAIFNYARRRLAFLVGDEALFNAIDRIEFKDYVGKLVVYFDRDPKGRLFEMIRGTDGYDKFIFAEPFGEIATDRLTDIDKALKAAFEARVAEIDGGREAAQRAARSA